ncbi:hypothetical protein ACET3X_007876 [Alternaria dauci]|uniref:Uncharacterized protein n=1 Tax=Alternaria dauci TaxID=48095 RepID=A0ABR3UDM8_9PLEO
MTENNPRRSQRKKVAAPVDLPAPRMMRSVNKYGFQIWIPAPEATDATKRLGGTKATPKTRFAQDASLGSDASTSDTSTPPRLRLNNEATKGSVLGKHSHGDRDDGEEGETDEARDDVLDNSNIEDLGSSAKSDPLQDTNTEEIGESDRLSSVSQDVDMHDVDVDSDDTIAPTPISPDAHRKTSQHTLPGSVRSEKNNAVEAAGPTAAGISRIPPTPDALKWRAAYRVTATGVHFFNMPVEDLREMTRLQALEQSRKRRPQSSDELRALFVSAVTDDQTTPEQYSLEMARVKLQPGRNATYGIQLKERMATMRMFAARAMQQPRDVVEGLAAIVEEARKELAAAQTALDSDIQDVASAKHDLENLTGVPVSDPNDSAVEEDALRRDNMISEINTVIAKYRAQAKAHE